jgi:hypothetical protein
VRAGQHAERRASLHQQIADCKFGVAREMAKEVVRIKQQAIGQHAARLAALDAQEVALQANPAWALAKALGPLPPARLSLLRDAETVWGGKEIGSPKVFSLVGMSAESVCALAGEVSQTVTGDICR